MKAMVFFLSLASLASTTFAQNQPGTRPESYPIEIKAGEVYEYPALAIEFRNFRLDSGPITVVPISCERGITGAVLIGNGTYRFSPEGSEPIEGHFRGGLLRFNPENAAMFVPPGTGTKVTDSGAYEMARHLMRGVFSRFWYAGYEGGRRQEALVPPTNVLSVLVFSKEHGELVISAIGMKVIVESTLDKKPLYSEFPSRDKQL